MIEELVSDPKVYKSPVGQYRQGKDRERGPRNCIIDEAYGQVRMFSPDKERQ